MNLKSLVYFSLCRRMRPRTFIKTVWFLVFLNMIVSLITLRKLKAIKADTYKTLVSGIAEKDITKNTHNTVFEIQTNMSSLSRSTIQDNNEFLVQHQFKIFGLNISQTWKLIEDRLYRLGKSPVHKSKKVLETTSSHLTDNYKTSTIAPPKTQARSMSDAKQEKMTSLKPSRRILCTGSVGRLGNRMFQFASGYAIAKDFDRDFSFIDDYGVLQRVFNIGRWIRREKCKTVLHERGYAEFENHIKLRSIQDDVLLLDFLQSWKYFVNYSEFIRNVFTFNPEVLSRARKQLDAVDKLHINFTTEFTKTRPGLRSYVITIHIRLTDAYTGLPNENFINKATSYFEKKLSSNDTHDQRKNVLFLVISDNMKRCIQAYSMRNNFRFSTCPDAACDMAVMTLCDGVIVTKVSTFSWWAGWLSGKDVVYDKVIPPRITKGYKASDYYPPHWIGI